MPSLMPLDALIHAADDLTIAIAGVIPPPNMTTNAIKQLIKIFKTQTKKEKDEATLQRVLQENAQAERVLNENMAPSTRPTDKPLARPTTPQATLFPPLEIKEYPDVDLGTLRGTPISNPDDDSNSARPAANTRYQRKDRTITQDYLFHLMYSPFLPQQFTSKQASACKYPLQLL
jgi:hypothetical protein